MNNWVVIPCFNEFERFDPGELRALVDGGLSLVLVDDGSTDDTWRVISDFASDMEAVETLRLTRNVGKAEAIRLGFDLAFDRQAQAVGYLDADFSTPAAEMVRLVETLSSRPDINTVLGSRWLHLGVHIKRSAYRHYVSRVFATLASNLLRIPVYDTQCGAKVFRVTDALRAGFSEPFSSRWAFDVELIGRLLRAGDSAEEFLEVPLSRWVEMPGSKVTLPGMLKASAELITITRALRSFERKRAGS